MTAHGNFPPLMIGKHTASVPVIQGGMGVRISTHRLVAAVANEGGIGVIATVALGFNYQSKEGKKGYFNKNIEALREEMRETRKLSKNGIIGVNCMVAITDYVKMVEVSVEEGANIVISGAGLPLKLPEYVRDDNVALVPIISSARAAKIIIKKWEKTYRRIPDAFIIESPNAAAGHLGAHDVDDVMNPIYSLDVVVPELRAMLNEMGLDIPIVGAGGIYDYSDIKHIIDIGGNGVQMGTRFVCTHECDLPDSFKQAYINAKESDVVLLKSPVGMPARAIRNKFVDCVMAQDKMEVKCVANCLYTCDPKVTPYCIVEALNNAQIGDVENGLLFAGSNVAKVNKIVSVHELMEELMTPPIITDVRHI